MAQVMDTNISELQKFKWEQKNLRKNLRFDLWPAHNVTGSYDVLWGGNKQTNKLNNLCNSAFSNSEKYLKVHQNLLEIIFLEVKHIKIWKNQKETFFNEAT